MMYPVPIPGRKSPAFLKREISPSLSPDFVDFTFLSIILKKNVPIFIVKM